MFGRKLLNAPLLFSLALVSVFGFTGSGASAKSEEAQVKSTGVYYDEESGQTITSIYRLTENGAKEISFDEFKKIKKDAELKEKLNKDMNSNLNHQSLAAPSFSLQTISEYVQTNFSESWYDTPKVVTTPFACPSNHPNPGCPESFSYALTAGESYTFGIDYTMMSKIKIAANRQWNTSATVSATYGMVIPPGKTGYLKFMSENVYSSGTGKTFALQPSGLYKTIFDGYVYGYAPKKLSSGQLAGIIYGVINP